MPWLLIKARRTHFFGDKWQECLNSQCAPSQLVKCVKNGELSVWIIEDDESNLDRVLAALASNCDSLEDLSFVVASQEAVDQLQIPIHNRPGTTPDDEANHLWHRDLVGLSNDLLFALSRAINSAIDKSAKRTKPQIRQLIKKGIESGELDQSKISPRILDKLASA